MKKYSIVILLPVVIVVSAIIYMMELWNQTLSMGNDEKVVGVMLVSVVLLGISIALWHRLRKSKLEGSEINFTRFLARHGMVK